MCIPSEYPGWYPMSSPFPFWTFPFAMALVRFPWRTPGIEALSRIHRHPRTATRDVDLRRLSGGFYAGWNGLGILLEFMPFTALVGREFTDCNYKWSWDGRNCDKHHMAYVKSEKTGQAFASKYIALQWGLMLMINDKSPILLRDERQDRSQPGRAKLTVQSPEAASWKKKRSS